MNHASPAPAAAQVAAAAPPPVSTPQSDAIQAIVNDPAVKKAMEAFQARIVHVEPRRQ